MLTTVDCMKNMETLYKAWEKSTEKRMHAHLGHYNSHRSAEA